jgi:hypothetical protein
MANHFHKGNRRRWEAGSASWARRANTRGTRLSALFRVKVCIGAPFSDFAAVIERRANRHSER